MPAKIKGYLDLSHLERAGIDALGAAGITALDRAREQFDAYTRGRYTKSGPRLFGVNVRIVKRKRSVTYIMRASKKRRMPWQFDVSPDLTFDTTGCNRQRVTFAVEQGRRFDVANGFVWSSQIFVRTYDKLKGRVMRRSSATYGSGKVDIMKVNAGMTASAAQALAGCYIQITQYLAEQVQRSIGDALK